MKQLGNLAVICAQRPELLIEKRTKRKQLAEVDIAPMIRSIAFEIGRAH